MMTGARRGGEAFEALWDSTYIIIYRSVTLHLGDSDGICIWRLIQLADQPFSVRRRFWFYTATLRLMVSRASCPTICAEPAPSCVGQLAVN
jgi:hypothetical protein